MRGKSIRYVDRMPIIEVKLFVSRSIFVKERLKKKQNSTNMLTDRNLRICHVSSR